jgi:hypothetical protein
MLTAFPLVILSPARPLFPVHSVGEVMAAGKAPASLLKRYQNVYGVYADRADVYSAFVASIAPDERVIGLLQFGDTPQGSLWRPYGTRKVVEVTPDESAAMLKAQGIHFIVIDADVLTFRYHTTVENLAAKWAGVLVSQRELTLSAQRGPELWYLVRL